MPLLLIIGFFAVFPEYNCSAAEYQNVHNILPADDLQQWFDSWRWSRFTTASGLPSDNVTQIIEASDGTPWVMTDAGLAWFDDYQWHAVGPELGIPPAADYKIHKADNGRVIIVSGEKLLLGNASGFSEIKFFDNQPRTSLMNAVMLPDRRIFVMARINGELHLYSYIDNNWQEINFPDNRSQWKYCLLLQSRDGTVWLKTAVRLYRWENEKWVAHLDPGKPFELYKVAQVDHDQGLTFVHIPPERRSMWVWNKSEPVRCCNADIDPKLRALDLSPTGESILAFQSGKVIVGQNNKWYRIAPLPLQLQSVRTLFYRDNGDLWVASRNGLFLHRHSEGAWHLKRIDAEADANQVLEVLPVSDGSMWLGTASGLEINYPDGTIRWMDHIGDVKLFTITALAEDNEGNIWIGSGYAFPGAFRWDGKTWKHFGAAEGLAAPYIHKIRRDRKGRLWFLGLGEFDSLYMIGPGAFVLDNGKFTRWSTEDGLPNGRVYSFAEDREGAYWFGTAGGLARFKAGKWKIWKREDGLRNERIFTLDVDNQGCVWFGHQKSGMGCLNTADGSITYLTTFDGLPSDGVWDIKVGPAGRIWIATDIGLGVYDIDSGSITPVRGAMSSTPLLCVTPLEKAVYVGTRGKGVASLSLEMAGHKPPPEINITSLSATRGRMLAKWNVYSYRGVVEPGEIYTRYRIDDSSWSPWSTDHWADVEDLAYGKHQLRVQARGDLGYLQVQESSVPFAVKRPIYLHPLLVFPLLLLVFLLAFSTLFMIIRRVNQQKLLRISEEQFRAIFNTAHDPVFMKNRKSAYIKVNPAMVRVMGKPESELLGRTDAELLGDDMGKRIRRLDLRVLEGETVEDEVEVPTANGNRIYNIIKVPLRDGYGRIIGICGIARDITRNKRDHAALLASEHRFRSLIQETSSIAVQGYYKDRRVFFWNKASELMYGYSVKEAIGRRLEELILPENMWQLAADRVRNWAKTGKTDPPEVLELLRKDRSVITVLSTHVMIINADGSEEFYCLDVDLSDLKKTEAALERTAAELRVTRDRLEQLLHAAGMLQGANTEYEALQTIADAIRRSGWGAAYALSFRDWQIVDHAYSGLTEDEIATLESIEASPEKRREMYGEEYRRFRIGRSYFVPAEERCNLPDGHPHMPGRTVNKPGHTWLPDDTAYVPMYNRLGEVIGAIALDLPADGMRPTEDTFHYLEIFADLAAGVIENIRLAEAQEKARESLRKNQALLLEAQRIAHVGNWSHDLLTDKKEWSEEVYNIFGLEHSPLSISRTLDHIHPDDREKFTSAIREAVDGAGYFETECRIIRPDGEVRYVHDRGEVVFDENGSPLRLLGTVQDITDRKRTEFALRLTQFSVDHASDAAFWMGPDSRLTYVNEAACRMLGYTQEELLRLRVMDVDPTVTDENWKEHWERVRNRKSYSFESVHKRRDGTTFPVEVSVNHLVYEGHEFNCAFVRDLTEKKAAEKARRESEEKWLRIMQHSTNAFYSHTPDHVLTYFSPQVNELLGYSPEELMIRWTKLITDHPINAKGFELTQRAIKTGKRQRPYELELLRKDGKKVWVEVHEAPVVENGKTVAIVGALTDITERKHMEEALRARVSTEKLLRRELNHRVRNNLSSLLALINLSRDSAHSVDSFAEAMHARVEAMASVHELLSGGDWHPVPLHQLINSLLDDDLKKRIVVQGENINVPVRQVQALGIVLNELLTNSMKYGALSTYAGDLVISWENKNSDPTDRDCCITLRWRESGGKKINAEPHSGLGLGLVRGLVTSELRGEADLNFTDDGVDHKLILCFDDETAETNGKMKDFSSGNVPIDTVAE